MSSADAEALNYSSRPVGNGRPTSGDTTTNGDIDVSSLSLHSLNVCVGITCIVLYIDVDGWDNEGTTATTGL